MANKTYTVSSELVAEILHYTRNIRGGIDITGITQEEFERYLKRGVYDYEYRRDHNKKNTAEVKLALAEYRKNHGK